MANIFPYNNGQPPARKSRVPATRQLPGPRNKTVMGEVVRPKGLPSGTKSIVVRDKGFMSKVPPWLNPVMRDLGFLGKVGKAVGVGAAASFGTSSDKFPSRKNPDGSITTFAPDGKPMLTYDPQAKHYYKGGFDHRAVPVRLGTENPMHAPLSNGRGVKDVVAASASKPFKQEVQAERHPRGQVPVDRASVKTPTHGASSKPINDQGVLVAPPVRPTKPTASGPKIPKAKSTAPDMGSLLKLLGGAEDPNKIAAAMTNSQYNPVIAEQRRQLSDQKRQAGQRQTDAKDFFSQLVGQTREGRDNNEALLGHLLGTGGADEILQHIAGSMSDQGARDQLGKAASIGRDELKADGLSQNSYDNRMGVANALRGRDESNSLQAEDDTAMKNMRGQLINLITSKGQDLTKNKFDVGNQLVANRGAKINQLATMLLLPGQVDAQSLDATLKSAQAFHYLHPTTATTHGPKPNDYMRATKAAQGELMTDGIDPDTGQKITSKTHFPSVKALVNAVNSGFVGSGLHATDPKALQARNNVLRAAFMARGIQVPSGGFTQWGF